MSVFVSRYSDCEMSTVTHLNMLYNIFHLEIFGKLTVYFITFINNSPAQNQRQHVSQKDMLYVNDLSSNF